MKKSTAEVNRANFETAHKIFFGQKDRVPGTAGKFDPLKATYGVPFQLGNYTFKLKKIGDDVIILLLIKQEYFEIAYMSETGLACSFLPIELKKKVTSNSLELKENDMYEIYEQQMFVDDKGRLILNVNRICNVTKEKVNLHYDDLWFNVSPFDKEKAYSLYKKSLFVHFNSIFKDKFIQFYINGKGLLNINCDLLREGINYQNGALIMLLLSGSPIKKFQLSFSLELKKNFFNSVFGKDENSGFVNLKGVEECMFFSDFEEINNAISWLMHVLTGPDPRTFDQSFELKEESSPSKFYYEIKNFKVEKKFKSRNLIFSPAVIYGIVVELLRTYDQGNFAENISQLYTKDSKIRETLLKQHNLKFEDFEESQNILSQYQQFKFMGCNMCKLNQANAKCSGSCKQLFCGKECHFIAHFQNKFHSCDSF